MVLDALVLVAEGELALDLNTVVAGVLGESDIARNFLAGGSLEMLVRRKAYR